MKITRRAGGVLAVAALAALSIVLESVTATAGETRYTVAVAAQTRPAVAYRAWSALLKLCAEPSGRAFDVVVHTAPTSLEMALAGGEPDLAVADGFQIIAAHQAHAYVPLIRASEPGPRTILVVRKDSSIADLTDLAGQTVLFSATDAWRLQHVRAILVAEAELGFVARIGTSDAEVFRKTARGFTTVGAGTTLSLARERVEIRDALRVVYLAPPPPPRAVVVHPRIGAVERSALIGAFLAVAASPVGAQLFRAVDLTEPRTADYERDYRPIEAIAEQAGPPPTATTLPGMRAAGP